jgi:hypothetical protein
VTPQDAQGQVTALKHLRKQLLDVTSMNTLSVPAGTNPWTMRRISERKKAGAAAKAAEASGAATPPAAAPAEAATTEATTTEATTTEATATGATTAEATATETTTPSDATAAAEASSDTADAPTKPKLALPTMAEVEWSNPPDHIVKLRARALESGLKYANRTRTWPNHAKSAMAWHEEVASIANSLRLSDIKDKIKEQKKEAYKRKQADLAAKGIRKVKPLQNGRAPPGKREGWNRRKVKKT